ncbi:Chymotrypsin-like protease CTRL-1 [Paramuricea clavata]|uniref:Metalloendopeptidase n=1 Tax=Paramuricea clavata TaxID=317549 RepID=A0A6S7G3W6_PARCT|nr:Chymotrypsin-like protease CTRL-1 [Paramuricea clavata]
MALVCRESPGLTRVLALLFFIYGFSSNNEFQVSARKTQYLARRHPWPNATIPYVIDCSIANVVGAKSIIKAAMVAWEKKTCIRFVKRTNQQAYLLIRRKKGCWGQVGYKRRVTFLSVGDGCEYKFVMMHELGHVIGFFHEHQRADRDEFVEILWDNVMNSMLKQFYIRPQEDHMDTELPYDYSSIMHYKFVAFAKNDSLNSIAIRDKNSTEEHTPYSYITDLDVRKTHEMYNCPYVETNNKSSNKTEELDKDGMKRKMEEKNKTPVEIVVEAVEVSLMSPGWLVTNSRDRTASIMVNGKEMTRNKFGMNIIVFNYLSGKRTHSIALSITTKRAGELFSNYIKSIARRNYFLIVSKVPSFSHLREARLALKDIGIKLPNYIARGSSICIVGYKGRDDVSVKYVIGSPKEKASFLSMNITLPSDYSCQNDAPKCLARAREGKCQKKPNYYLKACQKACGSCTKGKPCEDENSKCADWAKKQYCRSHAAYMLKYCKVSCEVCRKALPARIKAKGDSSKQKRKIVVVNDTKKRVKKYLPGNEGDEEYDGRAIGTRCSDKSETCPLWARVGRCKSDPWVRRNCLISCKIKGTCDRQQIKPEGTCSQPFGLGWDRRIPDYRFTASSIYTIGEWNASADNARLYMEDDFTNFRIGSWCSEYPAKQGEWLKVDLGRKRKITAVATQGRFRYYEHVKTYKLSFSKDDKRWEYYQEDGRVKELKGNCDHGSPVLNILDKTVLGRYVRFHPIKYYEGICMRVEVYGCRA